MTAAANFGPARSITAVVIGAGQAGLATSYCLTAQGIDHVVLERGEVGNSWRSERWDSLRLLTPNWQNCLPGYSYSGDDPHGYLDLPGVVDFIAGYARACDAPTQPRTRVTRVTPGGIGYRVETTRGSWDCRAVVIASGPYNRPVVPDLADSLTRDVASITPHQYRNPDQLADGGVLIVGSSATGLQIADEVHRSGRPVTLAVGEHVRMPRTYRSRDIEYWMHATGLLDERWDEVEDLRKARRLPSPQLVGRPDQCSLDLNRLTDLGVSLVGRLVGINNQRLQFSGSLANVTRLADLKQNRLLNTIDEWVAKSDWEWGPSDPTRPERTRLPTQARLEMDLRQGEIRTVIWATGFRPDYSWLRVPVLDCKGQICHDGGITGEPGLYVMGLPFMRKRKSASIFGAGDDAAAICAHLGAYVRHSYTSAMVSAA